MGHAAGEEADCENEQICTVCGIVLAEKLGHNYDTSVTAPDCENKGYTTYTCSVCGDSYVADEVDALGHSYEAVVTDPTCTEAGYTTYTCSVCGDSYVADEVDALGHSYEAVVTDPTCTEAGYTTYTCACGESYVADETAALGHDIIVDEAKIPTCTETGLTEGKRCFVCGEILVAQEIVPPTNHPNTTVTTIESSCVIAGSITVTCNDCGVILGTETLPLAEHTEVVDEAILATCTTAGKTEGKHCAWCNEILLEQQIIPATDHTWSNWVIVKEPQCQEAGLDQRYCITCYYTESKPVDPHGHIETITEAVPATCAYTGLTEGKHCEKCGEILVAQEIIPLDTYHDSIITSGYMAPTCTEDGLTEWVHCSRCNTYLQEQEVIPALGHTYDDENDKTCNVCGYFKMCEHNTLCDGTTIEPTCEEPGLIGGKFCVDCGDIVQAQEVIPATGHDWYGEWTILKDATCTEYGSMYLLCSVCNEIIATEVIISEGHSVVIEAVILPTCTEDGYTIYGCSRCNEGNYVDSFVNFLGHSFTNYVSNNDATYIDDGTKTAKCDRCDKMNTTVDVGSALGMAQKFRDDMAELNTNGNTENTYMELYAILQSYSALSGKEKAEVAKEFAILQQMINAYNAKAEAVNNELAEATEIAFAPIAVTSFAFLAALNNGADPVEELQSYITTINKEITRKREEFGLETLDYVGQTLAQKRMTQAIAALETAKSSSAYKSAYDAEYNLALDIMNGGDTEDFASVAAAAEALKELDAKLFKDAVSYMEKAVVALKSYEAYK